MKTAIVMGVGPERGLGAQLCERFATLDLDVFVVGRTQSKLDAVAQSIIAAGGSATAVVAPDSSPLRSSDLGSSTTNYISSREFGQDGPQVHISRHGSISIMAAPKQ